MIKNLTLDQEKQLANQLYYGGGYTQKYNTGGLTPILSTSQIGEWAGQTGSYSDTQGNTVDMGDGGVEKTPDLTSGIITAGIGLATAAIDEFDDDPGYGGADVGKAALQGAAMGANPALVAATGGLSILAGGAIGAGIGYIKKGKYEKEEKKKDYKKEQEEGYAMAMEDQKEFMGYANGGDIPYIYPEASGPNRIGYGEGWTGPPVKAKSKAPKFKPEVIQAAAKKLNLVPSAPDISARQDQTSIGINYSQEASDAKKAFMEKWDLSEGDFSQIDFTTKEGGLRQYQTGGLTAGAYSHKTNPLTVVDKSGRDTGMELTGGEGVFDKPFMGKLQGLLSGGKYQEAGKAVQSEMRTWKHK